MYTCIAEHTVGTKIEGYQQNWTIDFGRIQQHFQIRKRENKAHAKPIDCFPTDFPHTQTDRTKMVLISRHTNFHHPKYNQAPPPSPSARQKARKD